MKMNTLLLWVRDILAYLLGWFGLFILAILVLVSVLKAFIIRKVLKMFGYSFDILSGLDASLQYVHPNTMSSSEVVILGIHLLEGPLDYEFYCRRIQERIVDGRKSPGGPKRYPAMTKHIVRKFGYYVWEEDEHFSLDKHIRVHPDNFTDDLSLLDIVSSLVQLPFTKGHSPWEFVLIPKALNGALGTEGSFGYAIVGRMAHSLMDGLGTVEIYKELSDEPSRLKIDEYTKSAMLRIEKSSPRITSNPFISYMASKQKSMSFSDWCKVVLNALQILMAIPWNIIEPCLHQENNALHGSNLHGHKLIAFSHCMDLKILKDISSAFNCSINTVFFCCLGRAFNKCDPTAQYVRGVLPLAVLPPFNQFSMNGSGPIFFDIPLQIESSEKRLEIYATILAKCLRSPIPMVLFLVSNLVGNHLPLGIAQVMHNAAKYTMIASNLPAVPFQIFHNNCSVKEMFFIPNHLQLSGVGFSVMSYDGKVRFGVSVDKAVAPDDKIAQKLIDECIMELNTLSGLIKSKQTSHSC